MPIQFTDDEKIRRLKIVEDGIKTEFWKVISQSCEFANYHDMKEVIELHWQGKHEEAKLLALQIAAKIKVLGEPSVIIKRLKPEFFEWNGKAWIQKVKQIFSTERSKQ